MSPFDGVVGHEKILEILAHAAAHPSPAYLFVGPSQVGKKLIAERFARLLLDLSLTDPLDAHPDFVRVVREEDAKELTVKQARELIQRLQLTSARGGYKVALIDQADRWNEEATNALLKAVEEPLGHVVYLFIADQAERIPATLRSRLTLIRFERVPASLMRPWVEKQAQKKDVEHFLKTADGRPGRLQRLLEDREAWETQTRQSAQLLQTLHRSPVGLQCQALEQCAQTLEANEDGSEAWREFLQLLMRDCESLLSADPKNGARIARGLIHAWHLTHTTLSPRLALEWAAVKTYINDGSVPRFLSSP